MGKLRGVWLVALLLSLLLLPCGCKKAAPAALTWQQVQNATYQNEWPQKGVATLKDGQYEEEIAPGSASKLVMALLPDKYAFGDLNGDGAADAAAILVASGGGSGSFVYLEALVNDRGTPHHAAEVALGDRTQIEAIAIEGGQITVDVVTHGPTDPLCCPSVKARKMFRLQGEQLVER
jgi:hypothetical protein